uniref:Uncharacterized protein MANES_03G176900 n=1 Tax=Rhizophora mucronata TaxID=61149 RepID=A0A2P2JBQ0_RHIMU
MGIFHCWVCRSANMVIVEDLSAGFLFPKV